MVLVLGAGGHALEVLDVLYESPGLTGIFLFDDINEKKKILKGFQILNSVREVQSTFQKKFDFIIGVGQPETRKLFYEKFSSLGGRLFSIKSASAFVSSYSNSENIDVMKNCFVGPDTSIGIGTLVNTGAQIHHQARIGEFCEISPKAVLLGNVEIGSYSRIGANCTILPAIKIGSNVTVGAGSVVTKDIPGNCMIAGVPAIVKKQLPPLPF